MVANQVVAEHAAGIELIFRLGAHGPTIKFSLAPEVEDVGATYHFTDTASAEVDDSHFSLDEEQVEREVQEVVDSEYFQKLQELARKMRSQRKQD